MTDPRTPDPLDGETLSAYLAGELDEQAAAAVDARLAHDHELARRLDATARVLTSLRGVDEVEPPPDAAQRLRRRLAAEAAAASPADPGDTAAEDVPAVTAERPTGPTAEAEPAPVTALASRRRRSPWPAVAGVAAGLAAAAVLVSAGVLQGFGGGLDQAADGVLDAEVAQDDADTRQFAESDDSAEVEEAAPAAPAPAARPGDQAGEDDRALPVLRDEEAALAGQAAVVARYEGLPEAEALLGEPLPAMEERAVAARAALAAAPAFRSGARPGACLDDLAGAPPAVPVLVESAVLDGRPVLVYVLVGASPQAGVLDRVQVGVRATADCARVLDMDLR